MRAVAKAFLYATVATVALSASRPASAQGNNPDANAALIAKGKYLTTAGDCAACHTANGGQEFAGGLMMDTPFGPLSTPNITPDKTNGIGNYSDDDFYRVLHEGINKQGQYLYPAMPFPWYTKVTRDDAMAIKAYLFSLPPANAPRKPSHLAFPFNIREGLAAWDLAFLKTGTFSPDPSKSAQINRGNYLVEGLEHCGECHNGDKMTGASTLSDSLQGGVIDHWYAPNITSDVREGIGKYTDVQLFNYLKTGTADGMGTAVGPMAQTVHESLSKLTDSDLHDIVAYLKSTPPKEDYAKVHPNETAAAMGSVPTADASNYLSYCSSCHLQNGKGLEGKVPPLAGNGAVAAGGPETVIRVVLGGAPAEGSYSPMPAFGAGMTDQQIADVVNYVRSSWGNAAPATAGPGLVGELRKITHTAMNVDAPNACAKVEQPDLAKVIGDPASGIQGILQSTDQGNLVQNADALIAKVKAADPDAKQADIINSLTIAYCPIVTARSNLTANEKVQRLDEFSVRVYTQLATGGKS